MIIQKILFLLCAFQTIGAIPLAEQFKQAGYLEICDKKRKRQRLILCMPILMSSSNFSKQIPFGHKNYIAQKNALFAQKKEITTQLIFLVSMMSRTEKAEARSLFIIRFIFMNLSALSTLN